MKTNIIKIFKIGGIIMACGGKKTGSKKGGKKTGKGGK